MKVKMCLFPDYVNIHSGRGDDLLDGRDVEIQSVRSWRGDLETVPTGEPVIVRASTRMSCRWSDLAQLCTERGHLVFYDHYLVDENGKCTCEELDEVVTAFLERLRAYREAN